MANNPVGRLACLSRRTTDLQQRSHVATSVFYRMTYGGRQSSAFDGHYVFSQGCIPICLHTCSWQMNPRECIHYGSNNLEATCSPCFFVNLGVCVTYVQSIGNINVVRTCPRPRPRSHHHSTEACNKARFSLHPSFPDLFNRRLFSRSVAVTVHCLML